MKEYCKKIEIDNNGDSYNIIVYNNNGKINFGINDGLEGIYVNLTSKEIDALINILKEAKKESMKG